MDTIAICGGHFSSAIAVIQALREKKRKSYNVVYISRKNPLEGDKSISLEYTSLSKLKIPFHSIISGRLQRSFTRYTIPSLAKFPIGLLQSFYLLLKLNPKVVLSFGGYIALPVCIAAWILKIPIVTHEQTYILGLANRIISRLAKVVCISWQDTKGIINNKKTIYTGIPIRSDILFHKERVIITFGDKNLPIIYVTGGSLGSRTLNKVIGTIVPQLVKRFRVIHQTGIAYQEEDYKSLLAVKNSLPSSTKKNYKLVKQVEMDQVGNILHNVFLVIGRSGANTVAELGIVGVAAVLIPLPWSSDNEQMHNAQMLEKVGLVKIIKQENLSSNSVLEALDYMEKNITAIRANRQEAKKVLRNNAAEKIVAIIDALVK